MSFLALNTNIENTRIALTDVVLHDGNTSISTNTLRVTTPVNVLGSSTFTISTINDAPILPYVIEIPSYLNGNISISIEHLSASMDLVTVNYINSEIVRGTYTLRIRFNNPKYNINSSSDISGSLSGYITINNDIGEASFYLEQDMITEGAEDLTLVLTGLPVSKTITILDGLDTTIPTYLLTSDKNTASEGDTVIFTVTTTNVPDGVVIPYTINSNGLVTVDGNTVDNVAADTSTPTTGSIHILNNVGELSVYLEKDMVTEGTETLTVMLNGLNISKTITVLDLYNNEPRTYVLISDKDIVHEGDSVTFSLVTTNVPDGTEISASLSSNGYVSRPNVIGVIDNIANDISTISPDGNTIEYPSPVRVLVIQNCAAQVTFTFNQNEVNEQTEIMTFTLDNLGVSKSIQVLNTKFSDLPSYTLVANKYTMSEGESVSFTLSTINVPTGTVIPYELTSDGTVPDSNIANDFSNSTTGEFYITNTDSFGRVTIYDNQIVTFNSIKDNIFEGTETVTFRLPTIGKTLSVTLLDSTVGLTPTYMITSDKEVVSEGELVNFTITTTNVANGTSLPYKFSSNGTVLVNGIPVDNIAKDSYPNRVTGVCSIYNNLGYVSYYLIKDFATEGTEDITLTLNNLGVSKTISVLDTSNSLPPTYAMTSNKDIVSEGEYVVFRVTTTSIRNGTAVPYTLSSTGLVIGTNGTSIDNIAEDTYSSVQGNCYIYDDVGDIYLYFIKDMVTEGTEEITLTLNNLGVSKTISLLDTSNANPPTYVVSSDKNIVSEGSSVTFTVVTTNISDGTYLSYTLSSNGLILRPDGNSVDNIAKDVNSSTTGIINIYNDIGEVSFYFIKDKVTEGTEEITLTLDGLGVSRTIFLLDTSNEANSPTYVLTSDKDVASESESVTFTLVTTKIDDGTSIPYTINTNKVVVNEYGDTSNAYITGVTNTYGNFTIYNNTGSITCYLERDHITEGTEKITLTLDGLDISKTISILDTSTESNAPVFMLSSNKNVLYEGDFLTFTLSTINVPNATQIPYLITFEQEFFYSEVLVNVSTYLDSAGVIITPTSLDFGDIGSKEYETKEVIFRHDSAILDKTFLVPTFTSITPNSKLNLSIESISNLSQHELKVVIKFEPKHCINTEASLSFIYNFNKVLGIVTVVGSKSSLVIAPPPSVNSTILAPATPEILNVRYSNMASRDFRISFCSLYNDPLQEFYIINKNLVLHSNIPARGFIMINILYTPKQQYKVLPRVIVTGDLI